MAEEMDPLTQAMALLKPQGLLWKELEAVGDWVVRFPSTRGVLFSRVASGRCVFTSEEHGVHELQEGDFLLLTRPARWSLANDEAASDWELDVESGPGIRFARIGVEDGEAAARIVGGRFTFSDINEGLLEGLLPGFLIIRSSDPGATRLRQLLDLLASEASADRPGRNLALHRLLEVMLIELVRQDPGAVGTRGGLLAGLADARLAPALRAIHADIQRRWTVAELSRIAAMSRSMFAERFARIVGLPPMDYLLRWRMAVAKEALVAGGKRLAQVAEQTGYQSVGAFSAAFTRIVGCPPSRFAARG